MEDLLGKAIERLSVVRKRIGTQCEEYAEKYAWWAFIAVLTLSVIFGGD